MDKLVTMDGEQLMSEPLPPIRFVAERLLPQGLSILAGAPKIGKSWLALWLCLQVANGEAVWGFPTARATVLYLCLEDSFTRIQTRLCRIADDAPKNLHFATVAASLGEGLERQIEKFLSLHPDTSLIVIDTLQRIRKQAPDANPYAGDYRDIVLLKKLADRYNIAVILIHHLRKMSDEDPVNMISGTTGISGGADATYVLKRDSRSADTAILYCTGRDIEYRELRLEFDRNTYVWNLLSDNRDAAPEPSDPTISFLADFIRARGSFTGTATALAEEMERSGGEKLLPNVLMKKIIRNQVELSRNGIVFSAKRTHDRRELTLARVDNDGNDGKSDMASVPNLPSQLSQPSQA
ncbi:AAA family ATPase [Ethanoligenens harbinense]|uniref:Helicase DnaB n=1 Tax=Ethanoligenens harbinense (strain DSM 18485 / JCM 12961 / CGMCC 1.5033 / YUAN-3) TaxID=663278 RepID=E6U9N5_ETHHY|nr:AAA family ATPase [Ethanoligenens harbinense]ADU27321.1 hypothetical protein Ethha_1796 [Ethanoligenens harbinense YUAN-3]AVQ96386.1 helicase DnaB [Ethanoligenens harbinense YUAN-3]AYF39044.1 helicase DnaB [Ethanoligenens harbinense]AYF41870.1 helicase DnaB [Ethanoligenens harbinense]QCN92627.1 helicase DnaB [Ethanoligenens harbinense]